MMIKKIMYLLLLGFFWTLSMNGFSQETGPSDGEGNPPPDEDLPIMTESEEGKNYRDCLVRFTYQIYASNLVLGLGGVYRLPIIAPPMYLKVTMIDDLGYHVFQNVYPVTDWSLIPGTLGNLEDGDNGLDETAFIAEVDVEADLEAHCNNPAVDEWLFLEVELISITPPGAGGGPFQTQGIEYPYPIYGHTATGGIYSCNVFLDIPCPGDPGYPVPYNSNDLTYRGGLFRAACRCSGSGSSGFKGGEGGFRATNGDTSGQFAGGQSFEISALSNPFKDQLQLNWLGNTDLKTEAVIYNANGQLIERISLREEAGQGAIRTTNWASGIYFLVSGTGENQQVLKLIKQ